jgi:hypothetical protein
MAIRKAALQLCQLLDVDAATQPIQIEDDGQEDGHLRRRQADDDEHEDLAGARIVDAEAVEGHDVQARRVHHQLDADQHGDEIALRQHGEQTEAEQDQAQNQVTFERHSATFEMALTRAGRAIRMAPMMASSSTTDSVSKTRL